MKLSTSAVLIATISLSGCINHTSHRESFQYSENNEAIRKPVAYDGVQTIEIATLPSDGYSQYPHQDNMENYEDTVAMGAVPPPPDTYYPDAYNQNNSSGYYGYQGQPIPIEIGPSTQEQTTDSGREQLELAKQAEANQEYGSMISYLEAAANQGSGEAYYQLAKHYMKGDVVPENKALAEVHLEQAHKFGHPEAMRVLAWSALKERSDISTGQTMMEQAAQNSVRAKREYGMLLANLYEPHLNNVELGKRYLSEAIQAGDAEAAYQLYKLSANDGYASTEFLELAANAGHPQALMTRAEKALREGDKALAAIDYEKAALTGDTNAIMAHATNLSVGRYGGADAQKHAYAWFAISAENGNDAAKNELRALAGVKTLADREASGSMNQIIESKKSQMHSWNPNEKN